MTFDLPDAFPARLVMWATLYHALGQRGFPPSEVDRMESWQAAAVLGAHLRPVVEAGLSPQDVDGIRQADPRSGVPSTRARRQSRARPAAAGKRNLIAERVAHARGEGPKPEADPTPAGMAAVMRRLAGG